MSDVCELAHQRTVEECATQNIPVDCLGLKDCMDTTQDHSDPDVVHYGARSGQIFKKHYAHIIEISGV